MIDSLHTYPEYKDSGLPWLGRIPKHWQMPRMKHVFSQRNIRGFPHEPMLAATQTKGVVRKDEYENRTVLALKDLDSLKLVEKGDFVISLRSFQGGIEHARHRGIISPAYTILYPNDPTTHGYYTSLFKSQPFIDVLKLYVTGIRQGQNIDYTSLSRSYLPLPPLAERKTISAYVNSIDRRCARFIRNRRRLIEALNEQKQAIINRAVTRGLDPNAPLKPSGIDWLGDIPEHWEAVRFKLRVGFQEGPGIMAADFRDAGVPLLRISCLASDPATLAGCNYLDPGKVREKWQHFRVQPEDYLLSASASTGSVSRASEEVVGAVPYTGILRLWPLSKDVNMEFIRYFIGSQPFAAQIDTSKSGVAIEHFGPTHLKRMWISLPPSEEQSEIVAFLEDELRDINAMVDRASRETELIREYRSRLIADVVTGKVDVRHLAPPSGGEDLEEAVEELEPMENEAGEPEDEALAGEVSRAD